MPPLITREEALALGELADHAEIEALVERAWQARVERFGDSTDMCSLVNAKSGGCAEDCGFCAQSRFAEAETPMHAMMEPEQILEHARAAEAAGAHRFCMVTQGQGLSKRDFEKVLEGARLVAEHTNLKRCASIGHMCVDRARKALKEAGIQRVHHNVETARVLLPRGLDAPSATRAGCARSTRSARPGLETCVGGILNLGETPRAARRDGLRARRDRPDQRADQPAQPAPGDEVRRPRLHGPVGGGQVDRDLPPDPPRRAVPALRRPRREHRRAAAAGRQGRAQRRDDGQLPHHAGLDARGGPRDVRGARAQRRAPARQRRQPAARQPLGLARRARRPDVVEDTSTTATPPGDRRSGSGTRRRSCASRASDVRARRGPTARPTGSRVAGARRRGGSDDRHRGAAGRARSELGLYRRHADGQRAAGPARGARRQARAAAVLEQLPRARRPPARARGRGRRGDALGRRRRRLAAGVGHDDHPPPARGARWPSSRAPRPRCCSARATWRTSASIGALAGAGERRLLRRAQPRLDRRRLPARARRDVRLRPLRPRAPRVGPARGRRPRPR